MAKAHPPDHLHAGHGEAALTDPVCGMTVAPDTPLRHRHAGRDYVFCSPRCREKFQADPPRYTGEKAPPPPAPGGLYTCPMHPQIVQDHPGSCPICGMALEPQTVTLEEEENPELKDMTRRFWVSV
ncbi:MAG: YHS domain-containing protein, partial [Pseudomonadota bacterium]|nr:YHS domain-containing protein [Pseudomonadota bacterium]